MPPYKDWDEGEMSAASTLSILEEEDNNKEIKNTEYHITKLTKEINDLDESDNNHAMFFFGLLGLLLVASFIGGEFGDTLFAFLALPFFPFIFYMLYKHNSNTTKRKDLNSQMNTLNSSLQTIRTKERIAKLNSKELFEEFERHLENLRIRYSVRRENVIVGYEENEIFGINTQAPQYSTRTH